MPNSDEWHVPPWVTRQLLYDDCFRDPFISSILPKYSLRSFERAFDEAFPKVKFPRKTRLGRCDLCIELTDARQRTTLRFQQERYFPNF